MRFESHCVHVCSTSVLDLCNFSFIRVCLQLFQAEMFSRQQILYSIISDGHRLLDQGHVDDR